MSRDTAGPHQGQEPGTAWKAFKGQSSSFLLSLSLSSSWSAGLFLFLIVRPSALPSPEFLSSHVRVPADLQAPLHSNANSGPRVHLAPGGCPPRHRVGEMNRALEFNAGGEMGAVPRFPEKEGSWAGSIPKKCLDYIPALVGPHPLQGLYFAR